MAAIEVCGLRKEHPAGRGRCTVALDRVDLEVPDGGVFGFLGPNAPAKATTIRCLLNLARPTQPLATRTVATSGLQEVRPTAP